jgi:hypothetical protein
MKSIFPLLFCCFFLLPYLVKAQSGTESPVPYFRYSATAGAGVAQLLGDSDQRRIGAAVYLRGNYFLTHGLSVGLELQEGLLRAGGHEERGAETENFFHTGVIGVTFQPVKFLQDDHLRRIEYRKSYGIRALESAYIGAGIGGIYSVQIKHDGQLRDNMGLSYLFNANLGIELPLHSLKPNLLDSYIWNLIVNAQANFALDDELDRYHNQTAITESNDKYILLTVGVNLRF